MIIQSPKISRFNTPVKKICNNKNIHSCLKNFTEEETKKFLFPLQRRRATRREWMEGIKEKWGQTRIKKERRTDVRVYRRIRSPRIGRVLMKGGHGGRGGCVGQFSRNSMERDRHSNSRYPFSPLESGSLFKQASDSKGSQYLTLPSTPFPSTLSLCRAYRAILLPPAVLPPPTRQFRFP